MAEERKTYAESQELLRDNVTHQISPRDVRDVVIGSTYTRPVTTVLGTTYTFSEADRAKHVVFYHAVGIAVTLPEVGSSGFEDGWWAYLFNNNVGAVVITSVSGINDFSRLTLTLNQGEGAILFSSNDEFWTALPFTGVFNRGAGFSNLQHPTGWADLNFPGDYWSPALVEINGGVPELTMQLATPIEGLACHMTIPETANLNLDNPWGATGGGCVGVSGIVETHSGNLAAVGLCGQGNLGDGGDYAFGANLIVRNDGNPGTALMGMEINTLNRGAETVEHVRGLFIRGISTNEPGTESCGILIRADGDTLEPSRIPWEYGVKIETAGATVGLRLEEVQDGNSQDSASIEMVSITSGGTRQTGTIYQDSTAGELRLETGGVGMLLDPNAGGVVSVKGAIKKDNAGGTTYAYIPQIGIAEGTSFVTNEILIGTNPDIITSGSIQIGKVVYNVGQVSLVDQAAAIGETTIVSGLTGGFYRVSAYIHTTTQSTGTSDSIVTIGYTANALAKTVAVIPAHDHAVDEASTSGVTCFAANNGSAITYQVSLTGTSTNAVYLLEIVVERLRN